VGERLQLNKTTGIVLIVFFILLAWAFSHYIDNAYGETFEYTGSFPIPDNVEQTEVRKQITQMNDKFFEFQITYRFTADQVEQWYEDNLEKYEINNPNCEFGWDMKTKQCLDEIIPPSNENIMVDSDGDGIIDSTLIPEVKTQELVQYEEALERCEVNSPTIQEDIDFCEMLENINYCYRGEGYAAGVTSGSYIVSLTKIIEAYFEPETTNRAYLHSQLTKASLECTYQKTILEPILLGPEALHKGAYFGYIETPHSDRAIINESWNGIIPNQASEIITPHDIAVEAKTGWERMCISDKVTEKFKIDMGCAPIQYETTMLRSDGDIEVNAYPAAAWQQYKLDRGIQQLDKILYNKQLEYQKTQEQIKESHK